MTKRGSLITLTPTKGGKWIAEWYNGVVLGELEKGTDGFYCFWPGKACRGAWSEGSVRELANKMEELNADWQAKVVQALENVDAD